LQNRRLYSSQGKINMSEGQILFYFFGALTLISALLVVTVRNLVRSIFLFFVTTFSLAALFVFALADFIAVTQVVIYVGGVLVLMLFAFMLSNRQLLDKLQNRTSDLRVNQFAGIVLSVSFLCLFVYVIQTTNIPDLRWFRDNAMISETDNTVHHIGIHTMTRYLLPFEVVSVFLLMALIGAAHLARKEKKL
jgi:NAD(P)H-quinone oxidoreductase subunit 6